uniref:type I protein arginine methyltransferase n=1 Tax=Accipiter nisus TaxID=211598 RepID=A0A8B9RUH4_9AVES
LCLAGAGGPPAEEEMPELSDGEEAWEEEEEEEGAEGLRTRCLFCDRLFSSAEGTFSHCKTEHQFNVCDVIKKHGLDFYGYIKLINFVRLKKPTGAYLSSLSSPLPWEGEEYLKPELEDDLLLQFGKQIRFSMTVLLHFGPTKHKILQLHGRALLP